MFLVDAEGEDDGAQATVLIYPPIRFQLRPYPESRIPADAIQTTSNITTSIHSHSHPKWLDWSEGLPTPSGSFAGISRILWLMADALARSETGRTKGFLVALGRCAMPRGPGFLVTGSFERGRLPCETPLAQQERAKGYFRSPPIRP